MSAALPLEPDPFGSTADPAAYLPRPACETALAELMGALRAGARKMALTGPTGIGKTQLLRVLAVRLQDEAETLILPYAGLDFDDLCQWALGLLGEPEDSIVPPGQGLLLAARRREAEGRMLLLVLDDASSLPTQAARALAQLIERGGGALRLLVVPVEDSRAGRVLAALGGDLHEARLSEPMSLEETRRYVASRLSRCEVLPETLRRFDETAVRWMHRESGGVPRLVHHLALLIQRGLVDRQDDRFARREQWLEIEPSAEPAPLDTELAAPAATAAGARRPAEARRSEGAGEGPGGALPELRPPSTRSGRAKAARHSHPEPRPAHPIAHPDPSGRGRPRGLLTAAALLGLVLGAGILLRSRSAPDVSPGVAMTPEASGPTAYRPDPASGSGLRATRTPSDASSAAAGNSPRASTGRERVPGPFANPQERSAANPARPLAATPAAPPAQTQRDTRSAPTSSAGPGPRAAAATAAAVRSRALGPPSAGDRGLPPSAPGTPLAGGGAGQASRVAPRSQPPTPARPFGAAATDVPAASPPASLHPDLPPPPRSVAPHSGIAASPEVAPVSEIAASREEAAPEPAPPPVRVTINASPWARVLIDGRPVGTTPLAGLELRPGLHRFRLVFADGHTREAERVVDARNRHFAFGLASPRAPQPSPPARSTGESGGATSPPVGP